MPKFFARSGADSLIPVASSTLIRGLEKHVGVRLFDRDSRNVQLTVEGEIFERSARRLIGDLDVAPAFQALTPPTRVIGCPQSAVVQIVSVGLVVVLDAAQVLRQCLAARATSRGLGLG